MTLTDILNGSKERRWALDEVNYLREYSGVGKENEAVSWVVTLEMLYRNYFH